MGLFERVLAVSAPDAQLPVIALGLGSAGVRRCRHVTPLKSMSNEATRAPECSRIQCSDRPIGFVQMRSSAGGAPWNEMCTPCTARRVQHVYYSVHH